MDLIMYVCGMPLFTGVDRPIKFHIAEPIKNRTSQELYKAMDNAFRVYNKAGLYATTVHCDQQFKHLADGQGL
jgi:hypothetical protein